MHSLVYGLYFVFLDKCNWSCESQTLVYEEDAQNL